MIPQALCGVFLLALCGFVAIGEIIFSKFLLDAGWPYFYLGAANMLLLAALLGSGFLVSKGRLPRLSQLKWVLLRAVFSNAALVAAVLAMRVGAAPGDIAALTSINIVVAAVLGHVFLGESLRRLHILALAASLLGAALVARPEFLFGGGGSPWSGYALAAFSGLLQACIFVSARKSADASGAFTSGTEALVGVAMFALMPVATAAESSSLAPLAASPLLAAGYVAALFGMTSVGIVTGCLGSQWCPAAVGATVLTASTMVTGYLAQALLFAEPPQPLTLAGAGLMLAAVILMAATRTDAPVEAEEGMEAAGAEGGEAAAAALAAAGSPAAGGASPVEAGGEREDAFSDTGSLLSFAAAEFAQVPPKTRPVRLRRPGGDSAGNPVACTLGAVAAVASA